jgi:NAD-dependent deacetylase
MNDLSRLERAAELVSKSRKTILFTGAGISVESGIPPFRGRSGLWAQVDPAFIEINHFKANPEASWHLIRRIFYDNWGAAKPNAAHLAAAALQRAGFIKAVVTQNIDCLHQRAGSVGVLEFHGSLERLLCLSCDAKYPAARLDEFGELPLCPACRGLLKPDIVFFSEGIPEDVSETSFRHAREADVVIVVGTTGEVMPAGLVPVVAKENGAKVVEINVEPSSLTSSTTDIFLQATATEAMSKLAESLKCV